MTSTNSYTYVAVIRESGRYRVVSLDRSGGMKDLRDSPVFVPSAYSKILDELSTNAGGYALQRSYPVSLQLFLEKVVLESVALDAHANAPLSTATAKNAVLRYVNSRLLFIASDYKHSPSLYRLVARHERLIPAEATVAEALASVFLHVAYATPEVRPMAKRLNNHGSARLVTVDDDKVFLRLAIADGVVRAALLYV